MGRAAPERSGARQVNHPAGDAGAAVEAPVVRQRYDAGVEHVIGPAAAGVRPVIGACLDQQQALGVVLGQHACQRSAAAPAADDDGADAAGQVMPVLMRADSLAWQRAYYSVRTLTGLPGPVMRSSVPRLLP